MRQGGAKVICPSNFWILSVCAPRSLVGAYYLLPPDARSIFLHNDLLCNGTCSVAGARIMYWGGGGQMEKILIFFWGGGRRCNIPNKTQYPYEHFKNEQIYYIIVGNINREDRRFSLTSKLSSQEEIIDFMEISSTKTDKERIQEYKYDDVYILQHGFGSYVGLNK